MDEWKMDMWKYYDILHRNHVICNPMYEEKVDKLLRTLRLEKGSSVMDIACGKGELLVKLAELYDIKGVGVDISPHSIKDSNERKMARTPGADLTFIEMDGADLRPDAPLDMAMCIGADWIFKGTKGTIKALKGMVGSGGLVMIGTIFWRQEPSDEYLRASKMDRKATGSHMDNILWGEEQGMTCIYSMVNSKDGWDRYEGLQWQAANDHVRAHPEDPDNEELMGRARECRETFLRWERDVLGWAIYVFRKDG